MPKTPTDTDPLKWQRYFAVESNNRAWDLSVQTRTAAEDEEMLNAAHAAAHYWQFAGDERNHLRAVMLLGAVHAALGNGRLAQRYAERLRDYFLQGDSADWERALTYLISAHAAHAAADAAGHHAFYRQAQQVIDQIEDDEEREIVQSSFAQVPPPA